MDFFRIQVKLASDRSRPDWALMCKHVAAALYGVGVRLDENPALFFELRGINMGKFIDVALENRVETMLANAKKPSSRIIDDNVISMSFAWSFISIQEM